MAENPIVTDAGWSCTITDGSASVALIGILGPATGAAGGDFLLDAAGVPLALEAVGDTTYTLARPAAASSAGTMQLKWMRGPHRSLAALSTQKTVDVYTRQQIAMNDGRSQAVIAWQNDPPVTPAHADRYLVKVGTGAWAAKDGKFAEYNTSGTPGWLFTSPRAGDRASINGSRVRLEFDGTSWGPAAVVSSATTVDRLARFTDTAGGLGQSQMSEDGSGNVTVVGNFGIATASPTARAHSTAVGSFSPYSSAVVNPAFFAEGPFGGGYMLREAGGVAGIWLQSSGTLMVFGFGSASGLSAVATLSSAGNMSLSGFVVSPNLTASTGTAGVNGYAALKPGDTTSTGYLEFLHKDGTRRGYIGYASGGYINMVAEGGYGWNMSGNFLLGGDLALQRSNSGGAVQHSIYNTATGAAAVARLFLQTGTANSTLNFQINDNSGSPYVVEQGGAAITAKYTDYDQHLWRSKAGVLWATLTATAFSAPQTLQARRGSAGDVMLSLFQTGVIDWQIVNRGTTGVLAFYNGVSDLLSINPTTGALNIGAASTARKAAIRGGTAATGEGLDLQNISGSSLGYLATNSNTDDVVLTKTAGAGALKIGSNTTVDFDAPTKLKAYTLGTLPSAAAHSGETVRVTDGASNKQIVTSDGSVWRYSDGVSV